MMGKGVLCNLLSAAIFGTGLLLPRGTIQEAVLTMGMFAFAGGVTNAVAVKLLLDWNPGLFVSRVFPASLQQIRAELKNLILEHFFAAANLRQHLSSRSSTIDWRRYLKRRPGAKGPLSNYIEKQWDTLVAPEAIQPIIDRQLESLMDSSVGGLLMMVGVDAVKPAVNQFVFAFLRGMQERILETASRADAEPIELELDAEILISDIRSNVEQLLEERLGLLDETTVKKVLDPVIRGHLTWMVVWGNLLGASLAILSIVLKKSLS